MFGNFMNVECDKIVAFKSKNFHRKNICYKTIIVYFGKNYNLLKKHGLNRVI